jgi:hypothetical protein
MKVIPALLIITALVSLSGTLAFASNNDMKNQLLNNYLQRCVEVLSSKGFSPQAIKAECKCELDQIDQHFDIFQKMLSSASVTADTQQQINDFKQRLLQCKTKPSGQL